MQEVVVVLGYPAAGKTEYTKQFVGYTRLNRDTLGGSLNGLIPHLKSALKDGQSVVLDNLYPTVDSRRAVIEAAAEQGVPCRCVWVDTPIEDAVFNACLRSLQKIGRVVHPKEKANDPNLFPIAVIYRYRKEFEKPTTKEGFSAVERHKFQRRPWPEAYTNKAIILDYDDTLRVVRPGSPYGYPTCPEEIQILPGRKEVLQQYFKQGYLLLGVSNQSGIGKGTVTRNQVVDCFEYTNKLLELNIDYRFDDTRVPPIISYCRKPNPGLGLTLIWEYKLDPEQCIFVGDQKTDAGFAKRCGFQYQHPDVFFKSS